MKTLRYVKQEKSIALCDGGAIRGRWRWGLRLLRDPEAMSTEKSLKHGISEQLVAGAKRADLKLSEREIRYRIQCAKAERHRDLARQLMSHASALSELRDQIEHQG